MLEKRYTEFGGKITVMIQNARGHYPLTPSDPQPAVEFITRMAR